MKRRERIIILSHILISAGPKWIKDPKKWDRAEKIMKKYKKRYGKDWYGAITSLYLGNFKGRKKPKKK